VPTFGSLFSGIGGLDLGLERAGWSCTWQVENDEWCSRVLAKHWPDVTRFRDVHDVGADLEPVDLICGGFPCQSVSLAGRRLAQSDERWLWPEFARIVRLLRPRFVLVENVTGLLAGHGGMGDVLGDLAACGYDATWDCIPASAVGAPHLRYRVFVVAVADPDREARDGARTAGEAVRRSASLLRPGRRGGGSGSPDVADPVGIGLESVFGRGPTSPAARGSGGWWAVEPDVGRVAYGVPLRLDRLRALGNAVVPQVAEWIGGRLMELAGAVSHANASQGTGAVPATPEAS
jgi:DNA (cytosine-5)-methyltransferase 1